MLQKLLALAVAGALGTVARYALAGLVQRTTPSLFPWGTFAVNILGCFAAAVFFSLAQERFIIDPQLRLVILIGFFGAFTTFSSVILETGQFLTDAQWPWALGNLFLHNTAGLLALFAGLKLGRLL